MALQGPFVVVADSPAVDVVAALRADGALPVVETGWADAPAALASVEPEAIVLADVSADHAQIAALSHALGDQRKANKRAVTPIIMRCRDDSVPIIPNALVIAANAPGRGKRRIDSKRYRYESASPATVRPSAGMTLNEYRS